MSDLSLGRKMIRGIVALAGVILLAYALILILNNVMGIEQNLRRGQSLGELGFKELVWPEDGIGIEVRGVDRNSALEKAGIRDGDLIEEINGRPLLRESYDSRAVWGVEVAGQVLKVSHRRGGETFTAVLTRGLQPLSERIVRAITLTLLPCLMAAYILVGFWGLFRAPFSTVTVLIVCFCFSFGSLYGFIHFWELPATPLVHIIDSAGILIGMIFALAPGFWLLTFLVFPEEHPTYARHGVLVSAAVFLLPLVLFLGNMFLDPSYRTLFVGGFSVVFTLYFYFGITLLEKNQKRAEAVFRRRQLRLILFGLTVGSLALLAGVLAMMGIMVIMIPEAQGWGPILSLLLFCFVACQIGGFLVPFTFLNSFFRSNMLETESALKKKLLFVGISAGLFVVYLMGMFLLGKGIIALLGVNDPTVIIVAVLLVAITFNPIRKWVMDRLEERIYPEKTRYRLSLQAFSKEITGIHTIPELLERTSGWFVETLTVRPALPIPVSAVSGQPFRPGERESVLHKIRDRSNFYWDEITDDSPEVSEEERAWAEENGISMTIPMFAGDELVGTLNIGTKQNGEDFTGGDLEIFEETASHTARAVQTITLQAEYVQKKRMERDLDVARDIQRHLLPREIPEVEGLELFGESRSCFEVAGDYFDLIPTGENRLLLVIADVSGKGAGAALIMANLQASLRLAVKLGHPLKEIVCEINNLIHQNTSPAQFVTFFMGILDAGTGELRYINAGHNPPVVVRSGGELHHLSTTGMVLGVMKDREYELRSVSLSKGDVLTLYTDGYSEAFNPEGEEFGEERLIETIAENRGAAPEQIASSLRDELTRFTEGKPLDDDLTIIIVKMV